MKPKPFTVSEIHKNPKEFTDLIFNKGFTVIKHRSKGKVYTLSEESLEELASKLKKDAVDEFCDYLSTHPLVKEAK